MRPLSSRLEALQESSTMAVANRVRELAAQGRDVVGLQTGDPDFITPAHVIEAGHAALLAGDTHYPPARGTKALLEAIAAKLERENGVRVAPTQIIATPGGKWAIYLALAALLEPGDEVIVPEPAWVSYRPMIASFGGVTAGVVTHSSEGYVITADALRGALTPAHQGAARQQPQQPPWPRLHARRVRHDRRVRRRQRPVADQRRDLRADHVRRPGALLVRRGRSGQGSDARSSTASRRRTR